MSLRAIVSISGSIWGEAVGGHKMDAAAYRALALSFPGAVPKGHMGAEDWRAGGKIFATLHPGNARGALKLTPEQQEMLCAAESAIFSPAAGAWGRHGWTMIALGPANETTAKSAMAMSYANVTAKKPARNRKR
jgi:predicted DNA-binding protein (MmcQ/YjbR family)